MGKDRLVKVVQVTVFALYLTAFLKEIEKPKNERKWHDKVAGFIPYDFRWPTMERVREAWWNPYENRILTPSIFGLGWSVNLFTLLEGLGIIKPEKVSETDFLMPHRWMRETLTQ